MGNRFDSINRIKTYYIMSAREEFWKKDTEVEEATRNFLEKLKDEEDKRRGTKRTAEAELEEKKRARKALKEELKEVGARSVTPVVKDGKESVKITSVKEMPTPKKPEQAIVKPRSTLANKNLDYDVSQDAEDFLQAYYPEHFVGGDDDGIDSNEIDSKISEETHDGRTHVKFEMSFPVLTSQEEQALLDELENVKDKARSIVLDGLPENYDGDKSPLGMDMNEPLPDTLKHKSILRF